MVFIKNGIFMADAAPSRKPLMRERWFFPCGLFDLLLAVEKDGLAASSARGRLPRFMSPAPLAAVFLDRDGTLMEEVHYCRDPEKVRLLPGVQAGLRALKEAGYRTVIITNQSGIGRERITLPEYQAVHQRLLALLGPGLIDGAYYCADVPGEPSTRRKPAPGMVLEAARDHGLDLGGSWFVGDKAIDVECGRAAGARSILVQTGYGRDESGVAAEFVAKDFACAVEFILKHPYAR
jgi:D-glycero-D-manno-heptose 1,7-bisphosphate phosphatase